MGLLTTPKRMKKKLMNSLRRKAFRRSEEKTERKNNPIKKSGEQILVKTFYRFTVLLSVSLFPQTPFREPSEPGQWT
jgi:hypothetical protein